MMVNFCFNFYLIIFFNIPKAIHKRDSVLTIYCTKQVTESVLLKGRN